MTYDVTEIIKAIILLVMALLTTFFIPFIKEKLDAEKLNQIRIWVKVAVEAAEQIYTASGHGSEKKQYVLKFLEEKGITFSMDEIDTLIEAAVLEMNKILKG